LQIVCPQFILETNAAPFLPQIHNDAFPGCGYGSRRFVQLRAAVTAR
jgi:hypothetical protein